METRDIIRLIDEQQYTEDDERRFELELRECGYPVSLVAIDGSEQIRARHIHSGINFFSDFRGSDKKDYDYLNMACDCALYDALKKRTKINSLNIQNPDTPDSLRSASLKQLNEDCTRLGKLYWSVGYIHACRVYLDLGNYYSKSDQEGSGALTHYFREEAAKHFHRANILLKLEPSQKMIEIIFKDRGLSACGWDDPDKAKMDVLTHIDSARNKLLIKEVQEEMLKLLKKGNATSLRNLNN